MVSSAMALISINSVSMISGSRIGPAWHTSVRSSPFDRGLPDALEVHKEFIHLDSGEGLQHRLAGAEQFPTVVNAFGLRIVVERLQPPVRAAIGVHHQDHPVRAVQL